jgi:hypothetical protein
MKALVRVIAFCLSAAALPIAASAANPSSSPATSPKTVADESKTHPKDRYYIVYVLTTESRIPKRYVYRAGSLLATGSPERIYFNRRLRLLNGFGLTADHR